jgi:hypothetical protein
VCLFKLLLAASGLGLVSLHIYVLKIDIWQPCYLQLVEHCKFDAASCAPNC